MNTDTKFLSGTGEMATLIRNFDWAATELGEPSTWPAGLRTALRLLLNSHHPMQIFWGEEAIFFYNDGFIPSAGSERHPSSLGRPASESWGEIWPIVSSEVAQVRKGGGHTWCVDQHIPILRDGQLRDAYWTYGLSPIDDETAPGGVGGVISILTETTRRVAIEKNLRDINSNLENQVRASDGELNQIWDLSVDLLSVVDLHSNHFIKLNPAWTQSLGWSAEEMLGRPSSEFWHPDDFEASQIGLANLIEGASVFNFENRYRCKDGSYRWLSWNAVPQNGKLFSVTRDITDQKNQFDALAKTEDALRQAQKMEAIGQLTGGVAHDFNNLLTVIKSSTELLKRPNLPEDRRAHYVQAIATTVDRAAKLTAQLLAFARRQALKPEVLAVCDSVRMLSGMMETLTGPRIQIVTELPEQVCYINADANQFDTALVNMAVNARDAMEGQGQLTISVSGVEHMPAIRKHPAMLGAFVAVSVSDTGCGIQTHQLEQIFEPFFTTKGVGQGTGLGLSQVFGFAKQSGGEVMVKSEVGRGTQFTLYLPRVEAPERNPEADQPEEPLTNGHGTRVLVVEDNVDVGTFAVQSLKDLGYETVLATNAEEALVELTKNADRFDVVFSDVVMPGMNGIDLANEIRHRFRDLPVLLASGYSHILAQNGTCGFELLHKPYSIEQLSRLLRKVATWQRRKRILMQ